MMRMTNFIRLLAAAFLAVFIALPAMAAESWAARAERYMQGLHTAKAKFELIAPDQTMRSGTFYLKRPGRLRFEYDTAPHDLIVADGTLMNFYDASTRQAQSAPIQATLANFFLRQNMSLSGDLKVTNVEEQGEYVHVTVVQAKDADAGNLTLSFSKQPFVLKGWRVAEYNGNVTRLRLKDLQANPDLPASLFVYRDPSGRSAPNK